MKKELIRISETHSFHKFLELPDDILSKILSFCTFIDICNIRTTCKKIQKITNIEIVEIWKHVTFSGSMQYPKYKDGCWFIPGIFLFFWQDGTTPTTGKSRTIGLIQLVDVYGWLFSGYCTKQYTVFDLFGGVYDLDTIQEWRSNNFNEIYTTTFKWGEKAFNIKSILVNEDHELMNWDSGCSPPALECGCSFCFLPRTIYSVVPMQGFERTLVAGLQAFSKMQVIIF